MRMGRPFLSVIPGRCLTQVVSFAHYRPLVLWGVGYRVLGVAENYGIHRGNTVIAVAG